LGEAALENAQKLVELNYDASKNALLNAQENIQKLITAKDPKDVSEFLQAETLQEVGNQAIAHQRKVTKVLRESGKEFANVVEANIEQTQVGMQDWVNTLTNWRVHHESRSSNSEIVANSEQEPRDRIFFGRSCS
jgi:phasin family protein